MPMFGVQCGPSDDVDSSSSEVSFELDYQDCDTSDAQCLLCGEGNESCICFFPAGLQNVEGLNPHDFQSFPLPQIPTSRSLPASPPRQLAATEYASLEGDEIVRNPFDSPPHQFVAPGLVSSSHEYLPSLDSMDDGIIEPLDFSRYKNTCHRPESETSNHKSWEDLQDLLKAIEASREEEDSRPVLPAPVTVSYPFSLSEARPVPGAASVPGAARPTPLFSIFEVKTEGNTVIFPNFFKNCVATCVYIPKLYHTTPMTIRVVPLTNTQWTNQFTDCIYVQPGYINQSPGLSDQLRVTVFSRRSENIHLPAGTHIANIELTTNL